MFKSLVSYLLAGYLTLASASSLAQERPKNVHFPTGLELKVVENPALIGNEELCFPYIEARKKRGMRLPRECEFYDPNQSDNPLLEVTKEDLGKKISEHYTVGDFARIGKREQLKYARKGDYIAAKGEFFNRYIRVDREFLERLEQLREMTGVHLPIIDAFRSFGYNTRMYWTLGKRPTSSYHNSGQAVDIRVNPRKVSRAVKQLFENDGIGFGKTFLHLDTRGRKARWYY